MYYIFISYYLFSPPIQREETYPFQTLLDFGISQSYLYADEDSISDTTSGKILFSKL